MNNCTFIHNLDVSSTHMDEGGSCTVVKIASALILIIEKKSLLQCMFKLLAIIPSINLCYLCQVPYITIIVMHCK
jgi:hypothetical protein